MHPVPVPNGKSCLSPFRSPPRIVHSPTVSPHLPISHGREYDATRIFGISTIKKMETFNAPEKQPQYTPTSTNRAGRIMGGLFIVAIGLLLLAKQAGMEFPRWIFSFETLLIAVGLYLGIRHAFRGFGWPIPILIGAFLLIDDFYPRYNIEDFTWPLVIIGIGLFIIFRAGKKNYNWKKWDASRTDTEDAGDDYLDSTVVFGGIKKNIISKNFRGGESVTVFGGTEINLTQADITGTVVLDLTQVFGGTKLIVPPHWRVQSKNLVAIFGGIDDKRPLTSNQGAEEAEKVLILKGTCMLAGIEIRSY